jgi:hypothetical protein
MSALLYIIGLIIGITIFIYFYSTYQSGKEKIREIRRKNKPRPDPTVMPEYIALGNFKRPPGTRVCPLCGKVLSKFEALYASHIEDERGTRILIYGCPYCYRQDDENTQEE